MDISTPDPNQPARQPEPVMDIQPRRNYADSVPGAVRTDPQAPVAPQVQAAETVPATAPSPATVSTESVLSSSVDLNPMAIASKPMKQHSAPKGIIISALVVGSILVGLSVFTFIQQGDKAPAGTTGTTNSTPTTTANTNVSEDDVDLTIKGLDEELSNIDKAGTVEANDLSDATLGL